MRARLASIAAWAALAIAGAALAADEAAVLRLRADQLASQDRCDEALVRLQRAREITPDDAHSTLVAGRCFLRMNRYEEAVSFLEQARRMDPNARGIDIDLTMAQFHRADYVAAERELAGAEAEMPDDPRVALYRGLLLLQRAEDAEGARALERAGRLDQGLDPLASYYAGLAWERARERDRAAQALRRVQETAPGSDWAQQAGLAMQRLNEPYRRHWWVTGTAGMAYDSNAVLLGDGAILPVNISDQSDGVGLFSVDGGYELLRNPDWSAGAVAGYDGSAYLDLNEFDLEYPTVGAWVDRRVDDSSLVRLQPFGGYAWRDAERYMGTVGGEISYLRDYERSAGRAYAMVAYTDYLFDIPIDSQIQTILNTPGNIVPASILFAANDRLARWRNRDGVLYVGGYEQRIDVRDDTSVRVGIDYQRYQSEGIEYIHDHFGIWLRATQELPWRMALDVRGSYAYEPYAYPSTFVNSAAKGLVPGLVDSGPKRRDNVWLVDVLLERTMNDWLKASVRWTYQNNDSNTAVYKYDRHIVGGFVTVAFGD